MFKKTNLTTIAFYLPQYHPVRINDENWGPGFSDWINVARANPLFPGHVQPKLPGALGFYDLRCPEVMVEQADLANLGGVDAFCFYYYRFGSQRALEQPLELFISHPEINISFLYCWANEPWTRAWNGKTSDVLLEQTYGEEALTGLIHDLVRAMADDRYLKVNGDPVFLIYQIDQIPDAEAFVGRIRNALRQELNIEARIGSVFSPAFDIGMLQFLDFVVQFPPHRMPRNSGVRTVCRGDDVKAFEPERRDYFEPYESVLATALDHSDDLPNLLLGVTPDWDNSPRRKSEAHVLIGSTPQMFQSWTKEATLKTLEKFDRGEILAPLLFINAWNEWGEGAMLEPSHQQGDAYLSAFRKGVEEGKTMFQAVVKD